MTADADAPLPPEAMTPARALQVWMSVQTLKAVATPGYDPAEHGPALDLIGEQLLADRSLASGKVSDALAALMVNPQMGTADLSASVFGGSAGYTLHVMWPLASIFTGRMPRKVAGSTGKSYVGWIDRIRRTVMRGLPVTSMDAVAAVLDAVNDAYSAAVASAPPPEADAGRLVEAARGSASDEAGIYVVTTPTYLAHPPFGWNADDLARQDFRFLHVGATTVDSDGRIDSPLNRYSGLPEPYLLLAVLRGAGSERDYAAIESQIHRLLSEARHGPEKDGTPRPVGQGEGWFITRLPFILALADVLGLELAMPDALRSGVNEILAACQLTDWTLD